MSGAWALASGKQVPFLKHSLALRAAFVCLRIFVVEYLARKIINATVSCG